MAERCRQKERTRARILDEAARALRQQGTEGIRVAELMQRAGLTHGGFYAHFKNRDDLIGEAIARMRTDSREMLRRNLDQQDAADGLGALIDDYLSDDRVGRIETSCPLPVLGQEARRLPSPARLLLSETIDTFRSRMAESLSELGADSPERLGDSIASEMVGAMTLARAMPDETKARALLAASRFELKRRAGLLSEPELTNAAPA